MTPLIDGDVLRYEVGSIGQDEDGPKDFDFVASVLDGKILDICEAVGATTPPIIYLTGKGNFREEVAFTKPYKGNRKDVEKPWHFKNITVYLEGQYDTRVIHGMEADDAMSIEQCSRDDTVICTRDKDLRMVPGWHYGWECGNQREYGPVEIDDHGFLVLDTSRKPPKLTGGGEMFFWSQMLTGDSVDNIPGCPGVGPVKAYEALAQVPREEWQYVVEGLYQKKKCSREMFIEQANLLWMVRKLDAEGNPVMWEGT